MRDEQIRDRWREAGGSFHGPRIEHASMEERLLLRFLGTLYDEISELRRALELCASDLECEIEARYGATKSHPTTRRNYERDMESVQLACKLIGRTFPGLLTLDQPQK